MIARALLVCTLLGAAACARPSGTTRVAAAPVAARDTALVRRVCVAPGDRTVGPDSLVALSRSGCVLRDQRPPIRVF